MIATERIKARDLMRTDVACFSPSDSLCDAVRALEEYGISGAPVVDHAGKLLGELLLHDVARVEPETWDWIDTSVHPGGAIPEIDFEADQAVFEDDVYLPGQATVGDWMSTQVVSVGPKTSLRLVCQVMARASIPRVFVVEDGHLVGAISALDVVRLLAEG